MTDPAASAWHDPRSPWQRVMRRRARMNLGIIAAGLVLGVAVLVILQRLGSGGALPASIDLALHASLLLGPLLMFVIAVIVQFRHSRVYRLVPEHAAMVCPICVRPCEQDGELRRCGRCGRSTAPADLTEYWELFVLDPARAQDLRSRTGRLDFPARFRARMRATPALRVAWVIGCFSIAGLLMATVFSNSFISVMVMFLPVVLLMSGFMLVAPFRRAGERSCARCSYAMAPNAPVPGRCPECGADLTLAAAIARGAPPSRRTVMIGWLLMLLALLAMANQYTSFVPVRRALPTRMLINEALSVGFNTDAWYELQRRSLSVGQQRTLATALLDQRLERNHVSAEGRTWLLSEITTGALPVDLADRYFLESLGLTLDVPPTASVGEPIEIRLGTDLDALVSPWPHLIVGSVHVDDDLAPHDAGAQPINPFALAERTALARFIPQQPGATRIRLELTIVAAAGTALRAPLPLDDAGQPILPPSTVWSKQIELTGEVDVR